MGGGVPTIVGMAKAEGKPEMAPRAESFRMWTLRPIFGNRNGLDFPI